MSASQCITRLVLFTTECLAIVILNTITIIVFVKQRRLLRRSTYLIIHLAIVDFLQGAVSGPLYIEKTGGSCGLWENTQDIIWLFRLKSFFMSTIPFISVINIAVISLERVHATFRPLRHRLIKKWVYGVVITVIWLTPIAVEAGRVYLYSNSHFNSMSVYFIYFCIILLVICLSYFSIYIKVRYGRHPQHHCAAGLRERKLTGTLFLVTAASFLSFLPQIVYLGIYSFHFQLLLNLPDQYHFIVKLIAVVLLLANSLINPIIYAIRMPEMRRGILQLICRRSPGRLNLPVDLPLRNL